MNHIIKESLSNTNFNVPIRFELSEAFNNVTNEVLLAGILGFLAVVLALGESVIDKNYQKKYILISYVINFIEIVVLRLPIFVFIVSFFTILILSGINLTYASTSNSLEMELGRLKMFLYMLIRWFIISQSYLFVYLIVVYKILINTLEFNYFGGIVILTVISFITLCLLKYIFKFNISKVFMLLTLPSIIVAYYFIYFCQLPKSDFYIKLSAMYFIICSLLHLFSNAVDTFDMISFVDTRDKILKYSNKYFEDIKLGILKKDITQSLSFIIHMEDKDYFTRKSHIFSILIILKRKKFYKCHIIAFKEKYLSFKKYKNESKEKNIKRNFKELLLRHFMLLKRIFNWLIIKFKQFLRGYSTPQTQFIRTNSLSENSYKYTVRRKIFSEIIYTTLFFSAWERFIRKNLGLSKEDAKLYAKTKLLLAYFYDEDIFDGQIDIEYLLNKFTSRLTYEHYMIEWENFKYIDESVYLDDIAKGLSLVEDRNKTI